MKKLIWVFAAVCLLAGEAFADDISLQDCVAGNKGDDLSIDDFQKLCTIMSSAEAALQAKVKAETEARFLESEKIKALTPEFDPDKSGGVDVKEGGGKVEGELLALAAIQKMAQKVCEQVPLEGASKDTPKRPVYIRVAGDKDFSRADMLFKFHLKYLKTLYEQGEELERQINDKLDVLEGELDDTQPQASKAESLSGAAGLGALPAIGNTLAGFTQLFATDYTAGGVAVSASDDAFVAEVAACLNAKGRNYAVYSKGSFAGVILNTGEMEIVKDLTERRDDYTNLQSQKAPFARRIALLEKKIGELVKLAADKTPDAPSKAELAEWKDDLKEIKEAAERYDSLLASYKKSYDDLIKALGTVDDPLTMSELLRSRAFASKKFKHILELKIDSSSGSFYTKKNVWSSLGDMPFEVAGGATVHYVLYDEEGAIKASGAMGAHSGYYEVDDIPSSKTKIEPKVLVGPGGR